MALTRFAAWFAVFTVLLLTLTMTSAPSFAQPPDTTPQIRGFWVDAFNPGIKNREDVDRLISRLQEARCNAVFAQVRKRGDAYYWSHYEPEAADFQKVSYDPLAYLIEKAHSANPRISVHAWINMGAVGPPVHPDHVLARHPEWRSLSDTGEGDDKEAVKIDPGVPGAADWTFRVYLDVLRQYDVDGIHFDFVRYGGERWGYAPESVARFNARHNRTGPPAFDDPLWQEWRRQQVTDLVRKVYVHAALIKPQAIVSAATITWGDGPGTDAAWLQSAAYSRVYQDWRAWLQEGILDLACPMTYFRREPHRSFQENWANWIKNHQYNRAATLAVATYLNPVESSLELARINLASSPTGKVPAGVLFYSYNGLSSLAEEKPGAFSRLATLFPAAVPFPTLPWKAAPGEGHIKGTVLFGSQLAPADGATVTLTEASGAGRSLTRQTDGTGFYAFANITPGKYRLSVTYNNERSSQQIVEVSAGEVITSNYRLSDGDLPLPRPVAGLGSLPEGERVLLENCRVTVGSDSLGGERAYIADYPGGPPVLIRFARAPDLPVIPGDRLALLGRLVHRGVGDAAQTELEITDFAFLGIGD